MGFKEPVFWPVQSGIAPYHVDGFLQRFPTKYVVMFRHPYDVIASGKRRAEQTTTWPGFTLADGVVGNPARERLADEDLHVICSVISNLADQLGYNMEPWLG
jgi:hypothetical protein